VHYLKERNRPVVGETLPGNVKPEDQCLADPGKVVQFVLEAKRTSAGTALMYQLKTRGSDVP
jgi:hypothetical protein